MGRKGRALAERFKRAVADKADRAAAEAVAAEREQARRGALRKALLRDLSEFAEETGFLEVGLEGGALVMRHQGHALRFDPNGEADEILVSGGALDPEMSHRVYLEMRIGELWVWEWTRGRRVEREPLWDVGLEQLLVRGLELPAPE